MDLIILFKIRICRCEFTWRLNKKNN